MLKELMHKFLFPTLFVSSFPPCAGRTWCRMKHGTSRSRFDNIMECENGGASKRCNEETSHKIEKIEVMPSKPELEVDQTMVYSCSTCFFGGVGGVGWCGDRKVSELRFCPKLVSA